MRSIEWACALAVSAMTTLTLNAASAQGTLRIGMTASDIPLTTGQTDQGGEGMRFMGYTVYDGLINWDLSSFDKPSDLVPGLATSYGVDPADASKNRWIFKICEGVKFHDGSDFNADAAIWNLDRYYKKDAKQFDLAWRGRGPSAQPVRGELSQGIDDYTIEIFTNPRPLSYFPNMLPYMLYSRSRRSSKRPNLGRNSQNRPRARDPSRSPSSSRGSASRSEGRNEAYWDAGKLAKLDRMILYKNRCRRQRRAWRRWGAWGRSTGSKCRPPTPCRGLARYAGFEIVTRQLSAHVAMGPLKDLAKEDRPGTTCGCAGRPTWRSIVRDRHELLSGRGPPFAAQGDRSAMVRSGELREIKYDSGGGGALMEAG